MFEGMYVALVTPFKDNRVNESKLKELVRFHLEKGTDGLVPCGTTGECAVLSDEEKIKVVEVVKKEANARLKVIAGCGSNDTSKTISLARKFEKVGVDGLLVVTPYYNKPTQEGLVAHYEAVAQASNLPVILYNVPGRTSVNLLPETVGWLSGIERVVALKEASGNLNQISNVIHRCGERITLLSGDDSLTLPILALGGKGVISVAGNLMPKEMKGMISAFQKGKIEEARRIHFHLLNLFRILFIETNPIPVKEAMNIMGWDVGPPRLPLVPMGGARKEELKQVLQRYELLS